MEGLQGWLREAAPGVVVPGRKNRQARKKKAPLQGRLQRRFRGKAYSCCLPRYLIIRPAIGSVPWPRTPLTNVRKLPLMLAVSPDSGLSHEHSFITRHTFSIDQRALAHKILRHDILLYLLITLGYFLGWVFGPCCSLSGGNVAAFLAGSVSSHGGLVAKALPPWAQWSPGSINAVESAAETTVSPGAGSW